MSDEGIAGAMLECARTCGPGYAVSFVRTRTTRGCPHELFESFPSRMNFTYLTKNLQITAGVVASAAVPVGRAP
jgi:hypothetical protein